MKRRFPTKIISFRIVRIYLLYSSVTMNAAAPDKAPPRRISNKIQLAYLSRRASEKP
jgi:hypothetical protein